MDQEVDVLFTVVACVNVVLGVGQHLADLVHSALNVVVTGSAWCNLSVNNHGGPEWACLIRVHSKCHTSNFAVSGDELKSWAIRPQPTGLRRTLAPTLSSIESKVGANVGDISFASSRTLGHSPPKSPLTAPASLLFDIECEHSWQG